MAPDGSAAGPVEPDRQCPCLGRTGSCHSIAAEHLRIVTDSAPIGIFRTDAENKYVYTNPRWSEITGVGPDQATGSALDTIIASESVPIRGPAGHLGRLQHRDFLSVRDSGQPGNRASPR